MNQRSTSATLDSSSEAARQSALKDSKLGKRPPCPHCGKAECHGAHAGTDFGDVPVSRRTKHEAAFGDDDDKPVGGSGGGVAAASVPAPGLAAAPGPAPVLAPGAASTPGPAAPGPAAAPAPGPAPAPAPGPTPAAGPTPGPGPAPAPGPAAPAPGPAAPAAAVIPSITWSAEGYASDNANGSSTTVERNFTPVYTATQDTAANVWRMGITSITGGVDITVHKGGSRDPGTLPPTTQLEAQNAVTDMQGYYARGSRGSWHTESASRTHEQHHYREWKCSAEHYWGIAGPAIAALTAPLASNANAAAAVAAMTPAADAKVNSFKAAARAYWFTLADNASSRPYAAGQAVLNTSITAVQALAASNGWTVPTGTTATSGTEPPCYQPFAPYVA